MSLLGDVPLAMFLLVPLLLWGCDAQPSGPDVDRSPLFDHVPGHPGDKGGNGGGEDDDGDSSSDAPLVVTHLTEAQAQDAGNRIWGDGGGDYVHDECGVEALLRQEFGNDAVMDPDKNWKKKLNCGPRMITIDFSGPADGGEAWPEDTGGWFMNVNDVADVTTADGPVEVPAQFNPGACPHGLRFDEAEGGSNVTVEQADDGVWDVASVDPHTAVCREVTRGTNVVQPERLFTVPFELTIRLK